MFIFGFLSKILLLDGTRELLLKYSSNGSFKLDTHIHKCSRQCKMGGQKRERERDSVKIMEYIDR